MATWTNNADHRHLAEQAVKLCMRGHVTVRRVTSNDGVHLKINLAGLDKRGPKTAHLLLDGRQACFNYSSFTIWLRRDLDTETLSF